MPERVELVDEATITRMLRYALSTGAERLHFRAGCRPLATGPGGPRELRFRQLCGEDTTAIAGHLFSRMNVPERVHEEPGDAAASVAWLVHWPGEALFEVSGVADRGNLALTLDILRPLSDPAEIEHLER